MADFKPMNALEACLVKAATDPASRPDFYRAVLDAKLYVLTPRVAPNAPNAPNTPNAAAGAADTRAEGKARMMTLVSWQGPSGRATPIFTSRERVEGVLAQLKEPTDFVVFDGHVLFELLTQQPLAAVLNPGLPYGKQFTVDEMRRMVEGTIFEIGETVAVREPTRVLLGQPAVYPQLLVDTLVRLFRQRPAVARAYLALIDYGNAPGPHLVIGILSSEYASDVRDAGLVASEVDGSGPIDFVDMRGAGDTIPKFLVGSTPPFYERATKTAPR